MSGDLPIDIVWLKDFLPISNFLNITETREKFLSYLIFDELYEQHSGIYTCYASNAAATTNYSAPLLVKGMFHKWCGIAVSQSVAKVIFLTAYT